MAIQCSLYPFNEETFLIACYKIKQLIATFKQSKA